MTRLKRVYVGRVIALSEWLYGLFLHAYPATFRRTYGSRMACVFRDSCHDALQQHGVASLIPLWLHMLSDLVSSVCLEHWQHLKEETRIMANKQQFPIRLWVTIVAIVIAFVVSVLASINLYLIEDSSRLTQVAYSASPLLRFSYDGIYLSALAASVAICAIIGYTLVRCTALVVIGLIFVTVLIALGGFGGLLVRHATTFLIFVVVFLALTQSSMLIGRRVTIRVANLLGQRLAAILGACVSTCSVLLFNVIALVLHTLLLNMVNHSLYMQGQIEGTRLNFSLIAMIVAFLTLIACVVSLRFAFRLPSHQS